MLYRSFGLFRCPICFRMRDFVTFDSNCKDANLAECIECGYQFGYWYDEQTGEHGPILSPEVQREGMERRMAQIREDVLSAGGRPEAFDGTYETRARIMRGKEVDRGAR